MSSQTVFRGGLIHTLHTHPNKIDLQVLPDALLGLDSNGTISFMYNDATSVGLLNAAERHGFSPDAVKVLPKHQFFVPGFIDAHLHAPQ